MNKRLFALLVILTSLSLIGIIFVQGYWFKQSVEDKEEQFSTVVVDVLNKVTEKIEARERKDYSDRYLINRDSLGKLEGGNITSLFFVDRDLTADEIRLYGHGILKEQYSFDPSFFGNSAVNDSTIITNITSARTTTVFKEDFGLDGSEYRLTPTQVIQKVGGLSSIEKAQFEDTFRELAEKEPIHSRVSTQEIELRLNQELENRGIDIDFEYGIYSDDLPTKVKSKKFRFSEEMPFKAPIFKDSEGNSKFSLLMSFPKKNRFLMRSLLGMGLLSILFTLVIVASYAGAIYQLIKQKQISEIKSDFINNMTHEFKTPIATINLAIEAIKNPRTLEDQEKVRRYLNMIKDENKRMHAQVENVLRISKLEKNQLDISKERVDVNDIIQDAIAHVELIVEDRGGYIKTHLDAEGTDVLANEMHLTNVIVNILDNAVKYSTEPPKIDVLTELIKNQLVIKIQDQGAGMSKAVLKKVFEKFYREHTGNIHNVKGHGLGLAYVKKIIDDHQGEVYAESEKGKGSTFYIKLPII
jgi:two-component system phosphate regulon sensor histidine kinase PhoR